jgi:hypothetical protein
VPHQLPLQLLIPQLPEHCPLLLSLKHLILL